MQLGAMGQEPHLPVQCPSHIRSSRVPCPSRVCPSRVPLCLSRVFPVLCPAPGKGPGRPPALTLLLLSLSTQHQPHNPHAGPSPRLALVLAVPLPQGDRLLGPVTSVNFKAQTHSVRLSPSQSSARPATATSDPVSASPPRDSGGPLPPRPVCCDRRGQATGRQLSPQAGASTRWDPLCLGSRQPRLGKSLLPASQAQRWAPRSTSGWR